MATQRQTRTAADEIHISRTPIVKYKAFNDRTDEKI